MSVGLGTAERVDGLEKFIVAAKGATYAAAAAKSLPYRLGTSDIQYRDGPWSYLDSYVGEADFSARRSSISIECLSGAWPTTASCRVRESTQPRPVESCRPR